MPNVQINLLPFSSIDRWVPQLGDLVTRSRIFSWWGVIVGLDADKEVVHLIRAANPHTLLTMGKLEQQKRLTQLDAVTIKTSKGYAVQQVQNGQTVWYIS